MTKLIPLIQRMRDMRLLQGLSLRRLASILGLGFSTLARLERGEGKPDPASAVRIHRWLDSGEGSAPRVRSVAEQSWFAKMEARLVRIEKHLGIG